MFAGRVALVTGAASGLGFATASHLAKLGAKVIGLDLKASKQWATSDEALRAHGSHLHECDVTSPAGVDGAIDEAQKSFGKPPSIVVSCAGIAVAQRMLAKDGSAHPLESFAKVQQVNIIGTFNVARLCAARMAKVLPAPGPGGAGERGVIINTASVAAYDGQIGQVAYSASKGAVVGMTLPLARDLARSGIRVMCIAPGLFRTPLLESLPPAVQEQLAKDVPFPSRLGLPSEYAELVEAIVRNPMLNGEVIRLDGALRMKP